MNIQLLELIFLSEKRKDPRNYSAYQKQLIDIDFYVIGTSDY